jgi:hypothetical protein
MINPRWQVQVDTPRALPDATARCEGFRNRGASAAKCTSQAALLEYNWRTTWVDLGKYTMCPGDPDHVNWRVSQRPYRQSAAVMMGRISFGQASWDGDVNLFLRTPGDPARTIHDPKAVGGDPLDGTRLTELEFRLKEFTFRFHEPFWEAFRDALMAGSDFDPQSVADSINGPLAVAVGNYGLDGVHGLHSVIHPVMGLAILTYSAGPRETWEVFARNWGREGQCSKQEDVRLELPDDTLRLWLPWRPGADSATVSFDGPFHSLRPYTVRRSPLSVPFHLGDPAQHDLAQGHIDIRWHGPAQRIQERVDAKVQMQPVVPNDDDRDGKVRPPKSG